MQSVTEGEFRFELAVDRGAPDRAREMLAHGAADTLAAIDGGAGLTVSLLTRALVASCVRGQGGRASVGFTVDRERVRVEVSGEGPGFALPLSRRSVDYISFDDAMPQPIGWGAYLLDRLADAWGMDERSGVAWFEVDHASADARRLTTRKRTAVGSCAGGSAR